MTIDRRVERMFAVLTAGERAKLTLKALKDRADEDPLVRSTMPADQVEEFNRLVRMINDTNGSGLGPFLITLLIRTRTLSERLGWVASLKQFELGADFARAFVRENVKERITASQCAALEARTASAFIPLKKLARAEVRAHRDWAENDFYQAQDGRVIRPEALDRAYKEKMKQLLKLASEGVLETKPSKQGMKVRASSYYSSRGTRVPIRPRYGLDFEILPDDQEEAVALWRSESELLATMFSRFSPEASKELISGLVHDTRYIIASVAAAGQLLEEAAQEFGGDDPCSPGTRKLIERVTREVESVQRSMATIDIECAPPSSEDIETMMVLIRNLIPGLQKSPARALSPIEELLRLAEVKD